MWGGKGRKDEKRKECKEKEIRREKKGQNLFINLQNI